MLKKSFGGVSSKEIGLKIRTIGLIEKNDISQSR